MDKKKINTKLPFVLLVDHIRTLTDVRNFVRRIINDHQLAFHPDTPFQDYVDHGTGRRTFEQAEAKLLDAILDKCFIICHERGEDFYKISLEQMQEFQNGRKKVVKKIDSASRRSSRRRK